VDYALRIANVNKCFIEVKKPTVENLDNEEDQLLKYSYRETVTIAILTNGIEWRFYLPDKRESHFRERRFYTLNIKEQQIESSAERLVELLSRPNVASGEALNCANKHYETKQKSVKIRNSLPKVWKRILEEPHPELMDLISKIVADDCGYIPSENEIIDFMQNEYSYEEPQQAPIQASRPKQTVRNAGARERKAKYDNELPADGTRCRWTYLDKEYSGTIRNGKIYVDGLEGGFSSFSGACKEISEGGSFNGWINWEVDTNGHWILASQWRKAKPP
jgi:hypothetical protein